MTADLGAAADNQCIAPNPRYRATERVADVRAEYRVVRLLHPRTERVLAPVELVVAERGGGEPQLIEYVDDGAAERKVRGRRALKLIAAVEKKGRALRRRALCLRSPNRRGDVRQASALHAIRVGTRLERTMNVVRADDSQATAGDRRPCRAARAALAGNRMH